MTTQSSRDKTAIVIPAYNEAPVISATIQQIQAARYPNIFVVDDGSTDNTFLAAQATGAVVIKHRVNRGKGAATKTGIEAAKIFSPDFIVTMDADGQHDPMDIDSLLYPIVFQHYHVVLGTRMQSQVHMPWHKTASNKFANVVTWILYRNLVSDSQCGFRAYSRHALNTINTKADRYDYESEVIREIKLHQLMYTEVPIKTIYTPYSMHKTQRQTIANGFHTLYKMLWKTMSS